MARTDFCVTAVGHEVFGFPLWIPLLYLRRASVILEMLSCRAKNAAMVRKQPFVGTTRRNI